MSLRIEHPPTSFATTVGPPVIELSTTSSFEKIWTDKGSGAKMNGAFYRPLPAPGFFTMGDYGQGNYGDPTGTVITIRVESNDDPERPALVPPVEYRRIWQDKGSGARDNGSFWAPIPPFGYVTVGHVVAKGHNEPPNVASYRCLRYDLAVGIPIGGLIWNDRGSGADRNVSVYRVNKVGAIFAIASYETPIVDTQIPTALNIG